MFTVAQPVWYWKKNRVSTGLTGAQRYHWANWVFFQSKKGVGKIFGFKRHNGPTSSFFSRAKMGFAMFLGFNGSKKSFLRLKKNSKCSLKSKHRLEKIELEQASLGLKKDHWGQEQKWSSQIFVVQKDLPGITGANQGSLGPTGSFFLEQTDFWHLKKLKMAYLKKWGSFGIEKRSSCNRTHWAQNASLGL